MALVPFARRSCIPRMIMMVPEATASEIDRVVATLDSTGTVHAKVVPGQDQVAIAAIGAVVSVREMGRPALDILAEARELTGLPIVTELTDLQQAEAVAEVADVIQIGARNMQNYALLEVAGRLGKPVLLKRGLSCTLEELLMAADYILKEGNEHVILCERGIRTFETAMRFTLDLGAVPWLKLHTHLPVIVDPSHASGDRRLVEPLARGAAAVGADGIIVEVHQDPEAALCDGPQALYAEQFAKYARDVAAHAALLGKRLA